MMALRAMPGLPLPPPSLLLLFSPTPFSPALDVLHFPLPKMSPPPGSPPVTLLCQPLTSTLSKAPHLTRRCLSVI